MRNAGLEEAQAGIKIARRNINKNNMGFSCNVRDPGWVQSLGWEDPLEKGMAIHSSTLAWRIPWTVQSMWLQRVGHD